MKANIQRQLILGILSAVSIFLASSPAFATIKNESNVAVQVEILQKDEEPKKITVYPGQSDKLPENATQVTVLPTTVLRGDEIIKVKIAQSEGVNTYIKKIGEPLILDGKQKAEENKNASSYAKIINAGNVALNLILTQKNNNTQTREILPGQSLNISPAEFTSIQTSSKTSLRGDENVLLKVTLPSGEAKQISGIGEKISFKKKKLKLKGANETDDTDNL